MNIAQKLIEYLKLSKIELKKIIIEKTNIFLIIFIFYILMNKTNKSIIYHLLTIVHIYYKSQESIPIAPPQK